MQTYRSKPSGIILLHRILNQDGFTGFIQGRKDQGKTDFSLYLAEQCYINKYRTHIATNIKTESYMIEAQITNIPDLKVWLLKPGRRLFILDEAGKHLRRMGFMSKKNQAILELVQLIRHYDAGLICIAPAQRYIDSGYLDPDVIDFVIKKINKHFAKGFLMAYNRMFKLVNIPRTSIKFNSKDIAEFTLEKKVDFRGLPLCCQVGAKYGELGNVAKVGEALNLHPEQVRRELKKHCVHSVVHTSQSTERISEPTK